MAPPTSFVASGIQPAFEVACHCRTTAAPRKLHAYAFLWGRSTRDARSFTLLLVPDRVRPARPAHRRRSCLSPPNLAAPTRDGAAIAPQQAVRCGMGRSDAAARRLLPAAPLPTREPSPAHTHSARPLIMVCMAAICRSVDDKGAVGAASGHFEAADAAEAVTALVGAGTPVTISIEAHGLPDRDVFRWELLPSTRCAVQTRALITSGGVQYVGCHGRTIHQPRRAMDRVGAHRNRGQLFR